MKSISTRTTGARLTFFLCLMAGLSLTGAALTDARAAVTNLTVISLFDSGPGSLREAIGIANNATNGAIIEFDLAVGSNTIALTGGELLITNTVAIIGPGANNLAISGNGLSRVFTVNGASGTVVTISGLTITDGNGAGSLATTRGGGVYNGSNSVLNLIGCSVSGNTAASGGGIGNGGTLNVSGGAVSGNNALTGGGLVNIGQAVITSNLFAGNNSTSTNGAGGGAIYNNGGTLTLEDTTLSNNGATNVAGGAIYNTNSTLDVYDSTLTANTAMTLGGGIANFSAMAVTNSTLSGNTVITGSGGAIYNAGSTGLVSACLLASNSASSDVGGGIFIDARSFLTVAGCTLTGNTGLAGGGIFNNNSFLTLNNSVFNGNSAFLHGGGLVNQSSSLSATSNSFSANVANAGGGIDIEAGPAMLFDCTITNNVANGGGSGGGIRNLGSLTLAESLVQNNTAPTGGGVLNQGSLTVTACTLADNLASAADGGAIQNSGTATIVVSTLFGNSATNGNGGAVQNSGLLNVSESTFDENTATNGACLFNAGGTLNVDNTILANSLAGGNSATNAGTFVSLGHNISDDASASSLLVGPADTNGLASGLDPAGLQNNGGPTPTVALTPSSPAVDAGGLIYQPFSQEVGGGQPLYPPFADQRGLPRFVCGRMDIGAYQLSQATPAPVIALVGSSVVTQFCPNVFADPGFTATNTCGVALAVAGGQYHSLGLTASGAVVAWGDDSRGQTDVPGDLDGLVSAIAAGNQFSMALFADGSVAVWGDNTYGQTNVPGAVQNVVAIAAGWQHALALRGDGSVIGWGDNSQGQTNVPAAANNVVAVAAGDFHSLALKSNGSVLAWGNDSYGQTNVPAAATNVVAIAAGGYHSLALLGNGTVIAWGAGMTNTGLGFDFGQSIVPAGLSNVLAIAAGGFHSLALLDSGTVVAWGADDSGQADVPAGLGGAVAIAAGVNHSLAITPDATVVGWGLNTNSQTIAPFGLNADLSSVATITTNGTINSLGSAGLTYTVVDVHGETSSVSRTVVTVTTNVVTVANPQGDIIATNDPSICGAIIAYAAPTGTNSCATTTTTQTSGLPSGSLFPVGITTNTFQAVDSLGNTSNWTFTVTVLVTNHVMTLTDLQADLVATNSPGQCGTAVFYATPIGHNPCTTTVTRQTAGLVSGSVFPVGVTINSFLIQDSAGDETNWTFAVTVLNPSGPQIICPANLTLTSDPGACSKSNVTYAPTVSCPGVTTACVPPSGSSFLVGVTNVTCTATDAGGVTNSCSFTVTVSSSTRPAITCPADIVSNAVNSAGAVVTYPTPSSTNIACAVSVQCTPASGSVFPIGATPVVCSATDASGSGTSCGFTVTILGPLDQLQNVLSQLTAASQSVTNKNDVKLLTLAITDLTKATAGALWNDDTHPVAKTGAMVFTLTKGATVPLINLIKLHNGSVSVPTLQGYVASMISATRALAVVAISDAQAAHAKTTSIQQANTALTAGDHQAAGPTPNTAITSYQSAWTKAIAALIKAE